MGLPWWLSGKEFVCQCRRPRFDLWLRKIPWRRKWQPAPVLLPGESHGRRSLAGYSPWGCERVVHKLVTRTTTARFRSFLLFISGRIEVSDCWTLLELSICLSIFFCLCQSASRILVSQPGIEPGPRQWNTRSCPLACQGIPCWNYILITLF